MKKKAGTHPNKQMKKHAAPRPIIQSKGLAGPPEQMPTWMVFVAYLFYLWAHRPQRQSEVRALRTLIVIVGLVLIVVALVAAGAPEVVVDVFRHWPFIP